MAAEFKKRGWGRLYHGMCRTRRAQYLLAYYLRDVLRLLSFQEGDLVSDYGVNHRIVRIPPPLVYGGHWHGYGRGWVRAEMRQFEYEHGWLSCGCNVHPEKPRTREEIQRGWVNTSEDFRENWTSPGDRQRRMIDDARAGKYIVDEDGVLLPEYR